MDICSGIRNRRSIRRFQNKPVPEAALRELADLARLYASGGNMQPMKTAIISKQANVDTVFSSLNWAMYLSGFTIREDQRPMAYLVLIGDKSIRTPYQFDLGAMATSVMLAAMEFGLSSCCLAIARKGIIREFLQLPENLEPEVVIALGYADQQSGEVPFTVDQKYMELENGDMQVPKRSLAQTLLYSDLNEG